MTGLSDGRGALTDRYSYDAVGNSLSESGQSAQPFGYQGNRYDGAAGLYDFKARAYDPYTGRFASKDPVRGVASETQTLNPYPCGLNNPLRHPDPSGLFPENVGDPSAPPSDGDSPLNDRANKLPDTGGQEGGPCSQHISIGAEAPNGDIEGTVSANVREAEDHALVLSPGNPFAFAANLDNHWWFYNQVKTGAIWDYKSRVAPSSRVSENYAIFGNFNFGAAGAAMGYDIVTLLNSAGPPQVVDNFKQGKNLFADAPLKLPYPPLPALWDDPDDQKDILRGIQYYFCLRGVS